MGSRRSSRTPCAPTIPIRRRARRATVEHLELEGVAPGDYLLFSYRRNLAADDVIYLVEVSSDLVTWTSGTGIVEYLREVHQGDGTSIVAYRSSTPIGGAEGGVAHYMRLRVAGR